MRERTEKKQRETDRGVETILIACALLTSSTYACQCGLVVRTYLIMGTIMLEHKMGGMLERDLIDENL